jgi:hypothetical protein
MKVVAEYKQHAKQCRELAARMARSDDRKLLEEIAKAWEKIASVREHDVAEEGEA